MPADGAEIPLERFDEAIDERDGRRLDRRGLLPQRLAAAGRGDRADRARARRAGRARRLPGDRHVPARRARARRRRARGRASSSTCSARPGSASCGRARASPSELLPTQTGWFADRDIFEMEHHATTRRRRPRGGSSRARRRCRTSTPASPGMELMEEIGIAETRAHVSALNDRLIAGVDELGGTIATARAPESRGALICIRSTDAPELVRAARRARASSPRSETATCASRRTPTTRPRTSTASSRPRCHRALLA